MYGYRVQRLQCDAQSTYRRVALLMLAPFICCSAASGQTKPVVTDCGKTIPPTISLERLVSIVEVAPNGDSLLLFGKQRDSMPSRLQRPRLREVDPRSTVLVHFNNMDINCTPVLAVKMRGAVFANNTKRPLEIPRYYEAGVAQATPQARTMLLARARGLLIPAKEEADALTSSSRIAIASSTGDADTKAKLLAAGMQIDTLRRTRKVLLAYRDGLSTATTTVPADSLSKLEVVLATNDKAIESQQRTIDSLQAADKSAASAELRKARRSALLSLSTAPLTEQVLQTLLSPESRGVRREMASRQGVDPRVIEMRLALLQTLIADARALANTKDTLDDAVATMSARLQAGFTQFIQLAEGIAPFAGVQDLLLPDANITLSGSSVSEGERVSITIDLVSDDDAILDSKTITLNAIRLGYVVKNIRDVAFLVNRQLNTSATRLAALQQIRSKFISPTTIGDRLAYDAQPRSAVLPSEEHFTPAPGVVLEALIRPRPTADKIGAALLPVRYLGLSLGISVSLVQFSDEQLEVKVPSFTDLQKVAGTTAASDTAFALLSITSTKNELGIAPALHMGLFDGAISIACGRNLRSTRAPTFWALGFSFMGLTQSGQKLWSQLAGEK